MESLGTRICPYTGAVIELFYTGKRDSLGKDILSYKLTHNDKVIFEGEDFACSPLYAIDSDVTFGSIVYFLSLRPGDTDDDYFKDYTPEQLEWVDLWGEDLAEFARELEGED